MTTDSITATMFELVDEDVLPVALRTRETPATVAIDVATPRLAWRLASSRDGVRLRGYEIEVSADATFASPITSGFVESNAPFDAAWPAHPLRSRETRWARVRAWTDRGRTVWGAPLRIEAALLDRRDWKARPISTTANIGHIDPVPVPLLRRSFYLPTKVASARLYVTSLGIHATTINGAVVSADLLDPGWSEYQGRLLYAAHDVTDLLHPGENVLASAIGDGWWRGELTWLKRRAVYGDTTALLAQLEIELTDGSTVTIGTDEDWLGSTGGLLAADLYNGSDCDLRREPRGWRLPGFADESWQKVTSLELPPRLELRSMAGVRVVDSWTVAELRSAVGTLLYDCGQNVTGWLRLKVRGPAGATIVVRHAEVLDDDGRLYTAALRNARAIDRYVLDDAGSFSLEPSFTFHGFRFAEIAADPGVAIDLAEVRVVSSIGEETGTFSCSEPLVDKLWSNVRWSQRGNFLAIPTDCPQRDERMGWTGDIQVFAPTACLNADVGPFLASWLKDLEIGQRGDGAVSSVVPNCIADQHFAFGAAGWGDAAVHVPWALYEAYGDAQVLRDQFASMTAWIDWCASRLNDDGVWDGDFQFGDWLDPNAPPERPQEAATPSGFVATAYLSRSARTVGRISRIIGEVDHVADYERIADDAARAAWSKWGDAALSTQTGCAIAIEFGIAPPDDRLAIGRQLANLVRGGDGRIGTGFLGTPLVLPALTRTGQLDAAYELLLNRRAPGWLYQVLRGGTTMWERWDAIREDGSIHPGNMDATDGASMMSFNHYAYGSVASWLYRTVAGLAPDAPGYSRIRFAPQPGGGLTHANARTMSPFGPVTIAWRLDDDGELTIELDVPPGSTAVLVSPRGWDDGGSNQVAFASGHHVIGPLAPGNPISKPRVNEER